MGAFPKCAEFPISRDPPEGGTRYHNGYYVQARFQSFQFLGIPPKGELEKNVDNRPVPVCFQFLGIPPKGEHDPGGPTNRGITQFPISRDPPEGGTDSIKQGMRLRLTRFPISRDPPEGGTSIHKNKKGEKVERAFSPHRRSGPGSVSLEFLPDSGLVQSPASGIHPNSGLTAPLQAGKPPSRAGEIRKPPSRAGVSNF